MALLAGSVYNNISTLYGDLLTGYDKRIAPRINQYPPVEVTFMFKLLNLIDFETATQKLSILGLFYFFWTDELLRWNPQNYGGIGAAKFPLNQVWSPTIALAKSFDGQANVEDPSDVGFYLYTGNATWIHLGKYNLLCEVSIRFYPFDQQSCKILIFVKYSYASEVVLEPVPQGAVGTESYNENSEWKLIGMSTFRSEFVLGTYYNGIVINLERRVDFISYTVISPLILLSLLNVCVFLVPVDSGEKASTSVTIFLSYGIFVSAIRDALPPNSINVSYLLSYIQLLLLFSVFSVIYSFIQSWIFAHYAEAAVSCGVLSRMCRNCKPNGKTLKNTNKVNPSKTDGNSQLVTATTTEDEKEREVSRRMTWKQLMKRIDVIIFVFMPCIGVVSSAVFFIFLSTRKRL